MVGKYALICAMEIQKIHIFDSWKYQGNRKIEISVFQIWVRQAKIIKLVEHRVAVFLKTFYLLHQQK